MNSVLTYELTITAISLLVSLRCFGQTATTGRLIAGTTNRASHRSKATADSLTTVLLRTVEADQHNRNQMTPVAADQIDQRRTAVSLVPLA